MEKNLEKESEQFDFEAAYTDLKKDHDLPEFESLTQDFDIEKIQDKETAFLAREIRRTINEKITAYIHLFETLTNPQSPPMFVFKILKNISSEEKEIIQEFYNTLSKTQIEIMKLDTVYSEKNEIKFIKHAYQTWQNMSPKIYTLFESIESNFEKNDKSADRSYFD